MASQATINALSEMMQERKKLLTDMQALNERDAFGPLEQEQWDKMDVRYQELDKSISREQRAAKLADELKRPVLEPRAQLASAGFESSREYRDLFARALATGNMAELRGTINGNSNSTSNAPVPTDMQRRIVELVQKQLVLRSVATVYTVGSDQQITIDASTPTGYLVDESTTTTDSYAAPTNSVTESSITFTRKTVGDFAYAVRVPVTKFAYQDYVGGGDFIARKVGEGVYLAEEQYLMTGDGSVSATANPAQPNGVITVIKAATGQRHVATASTTGNGLATIAADDVIDTVHKMLPRYRQGGLRWMMGDAVAKTVRKLKDGSNRYLWQVSDNVAEGLSNGINGSLYGIPVSISEFMPTTTAANDVAAVCGNWSYVEIYDRGPLEFFVDTTSQAQKLMTILQAWKRSDLVVTNVNAFGYLAFK
jgi:HK97 family phage major capsid protein